MAIKWKIDPAHSEIQFKVKHLMLTTVTGYFRQFDLELETESEDFTTARNLVFTADISSIDTNNSQRDAHLKSDDFFNQEQYPQLRFVGKKISGTPEAGKLEGDLTIRDVTKPVTLDVIHEGTAVDPYGQTKAGFTVQGRINRKDFNLKWSAVTEAGSVVVSDEVRILAEVQLIKQS